jgi:hypothetical protein
MQLKGAGMKKIMMVFVVAAFILTAVSPIMASAGSGDPVKDTAKYSGNVVTGSVNTVGEAAKGTTEVAASPFVALWKAMTGQGKAENVVTDPVNKSGKTVYDATVNTGKTVTGQEVE